MIDLSSHPFVLKIMERLRPQIKARIPKVREAARKGKVRIKDEYELSEQEWYDYEVFIHVSSIISTIDRLEQCQNFIKKFPRPRSYEKEGITQDVWIEYHYSFYVISLVSLFDICLILTNAVFRLGNEEKNCKPDLIIKNSWVKDTSAKESLKKIEQLIKPHRHDRNLHVHRGKIPNIALVMDSEELDRIKLFSLVQRLDKPFIDKRLMDLVYNDETSKINSRLTEETNNIKISLSNLFDNILPVYRHHISRFQT